MASPIFFPASVAPTNSGHLAKGSRQHHERIVVIDAACKRYLKRGHRERDGHGLSPEPQPSLDPSSE
jgi:hypothetical protein